MLTESCVSDLLAGIVDFSADVSSERSTIMGGNTRNYYSPQGIGLAHLDALSKRHLATTSRQSPTTPILQLRFCTPLAFNRK